jgi:hypothetical protein
MSSKGPRSLPWKPRNAISARSRRRQQHVPRPRMSGLRRRGFREGVLHGPFLTHISGCTVTATYCSNTFVALIPATCLAKIALYPSRDIGGHGSNSAPPNQLKFAYYKGIPSSNKVTSDQLHNKIFSFIILSVLSEKIYKYTTNIPFGIMALNGNAFVIGGGKTAQSPTTRNLQFCNL